jgi:hypothetical protein
MISSVNHQRLALILIFKKGMRAGEVAQVVEHLHKSVRLSSNPSTTKKKEKLHLLDIGGSHL